MTIQGAISELVNLLNADDIPIYYKGGIKKVIETIDDYIDGKDDYVKRRADTKTEPTQDQHIQRVEYVGSDEKSRCWKCKHFKRMHETPIASDGNYYNYVVCTTNKCKYEPKTEPEFAKDTNVRSKDEPYIDIETGVLHWCGWEYKRIEPEHEIVRCKDCENWETEWQDDWAENWHYCPIVDGTHNGDWYCADAERRTDE